MLREAYLDKEQTIYDYGTAPIDGENVIDVTKTGMSYYNDFLNPSGLRYLQTHKNLTGKIINMTPKEYFERCARDIFNNSVSSLIAQREADKRTNNLLDRVLNEYKLKLCLPMINYADKGQEGLHRMLAIARNYGWDKSVPVLVVDYFDKERAKQEQDKKFVLKLTNKLYDAVRNAIQYHYNNLDEFKEELENWSCEKAFEYEDDVKKPVEIKFEEFSDHYVVSLKQYSAVRAEIPKYAVQLDKQDTDDFDLDIDKFIDSEDLIDLDESVSNEFLFHGTNNIVSILQSDSLKLGRRYADGQAVCLTRNYEFASRFDYVIVLDRKKLHNDYSLKLKSDSKNMRNTFTRVTNGQSKAEEVSLKTINDLHKYIVAIVTDKDLHCDYKIIPKTGATRFSIGKQLTENYDADMKGLLITILDKYVNCYYESSKMACELICEELCYEHNLDADFQGRTICINNDKIATLRAVKDGPDLVAITGYTLYI